MAAYRYNDMADRIDDVLTELLAKQSEPTPEVASGENAEPGTQKPTADLSSEGQEKAPELQEHEERGNAPENQSAEQQGAQEPPAAEQPLQAQHEPAAAKPENELLTRIGNDYERMRQENAQLKDIVAQLKGVIPQFQNALSQQSQEAEKHIVEKTVEPPILDMESVQYMTDEDRRAATAKYSTAMADYAKQTVLNEVMKEMQPIVDSYKRQTAEAADMTARNRIRGSKGFEDFDDYGDAIDRIAANTPGFDGIEPEMKYALSYMINRGINDMQRKPEVETTEMLVEKVKNNPDALRALEEMRVRQAAEKNASVPPVTASQGQATAPAVKSEAPRSLDEASERAYKMLGLRRF